MTAVDVDTRTDVYALGVLLYELLSGELPFDSSELRKAGYDEIRRKIREEEPPKPSTRLSTLSGERSTAAAQRRQTDPGSLRRKVQGDLDWIAMKALEKDRTRRYGSPNELAADIGRHLSYEPVEAGPPSATYRAKKFVRRNRVAVSFAGVVLVLLMGFAVTMTVQAQRIADERDRANAEAKRANREAETANRVSEFMTRLFEIPDPGEARGNSITAREILDRGAQQIERGLDDEPLIKARLLATMGKTYLGLGIYEMVEQLLGQVLHLGGASDTMRADSTCLLAMAFFWRGQSTEALTTSRECLELRRESPSPDHPEIARAQSVLALHLLRAGGLEEAESLLGEAASIWEKHPETTDWRAALTYAVMRRLHTVKGEHEEGLAVALKGLEIFERNEAIDGYWNSTLVPILSQVGGAYFQAGEYESALRMYDRAIAWNEQMGGNEHPQVTWALSNKARVLIRVSRYEEAVKVARKVVARRIEDYGPEHPMTVGQYYVLALALLKSGQEEEGRSVCVLAMDNWDHRLSSAGSSKPITRSCRRFWRTMRASYVMWVATPRLPSRRRRRRLSGPSLPNAPMRLPKVTMTEQTNCPHCGAVRAGELPVKWDVY
jgi:non-specific serine/threonine protein kinase/serine/threonine-protein kinase